jgi:small subunit ribosomal protein S16
MAVRLRLARVGGKGKPIYRIVAADSESPRNGAFLEIVGNYNPNKNPAEVVLKEERIREWVKLGAKPTLTVSQIIKRKGVGI